MAEGTSTFAHKEGDRIQFKDGRDRATGKDNMRVGFVMSREAAEGDYPNGYMISFKMKETGQNRLVRWAASDVLPADPEQFSFKVGAAVQVLDSKITGKVFEVAPSTHDQLEPSYAVMFKDENGQSALAWWSESALTAAS
jgi:hypothetical protein